MVLPRGRYGIFGFSPTFTHSHPFHTFFCSSSPWTPTLWCGPLSWGDGLPRFGVASSLCDGLPGFCLTTVECPMRGRIPADEDAWLYHKSKTKVDVDCLLEATLPPGPVEDEVDSYAALGLNGNTFGGFFILLAGNEHNGPK